MANFARRAASIQALNPMLGRTAIGEGDEVYQGWLLKKAPQSADTDKVASVGRSLRMVANSIWSTVVRNGDFKRRYFVLDGYDLRYYKDEKARDYVGRIDLGTVLEVRKSADADAPSQSLDLVTDARIFTVSAESIDEYEEWKVRLQGVIAASRRRGLLAKSLRASAAALASGQGSGPSGTPTAMGGSGSKEGGGNSVLVLAASIAEPSLESQRVEPDGSAPSMAAPQRAMSRREAAELSAIAPPFIADKAQFRRKSVVYSAPLVGMEGYMKAATPDRRPLSRWESLSGNTPIWKMSFLQPDRLQHVPLFASVLAQRDPPPSRFAGSSSRNVKRAAMLEAGKKMKNKGKKKKGEGGKEKADTKKAKKKKKKKKKAKAASGDAEGDEDDDDEEEEEEDAAQAQGLGKFWVNAMQAYAKNAKAEHSYMTPDGVTAAGEAAAQAQREEDVRLAASRAAAGKPGTPRTKPPAPAASSRPAGASSAPSIEGPAPALGSGAPAPPPAGQGGRGPDADMERLQARLRAMGRLTTRIVRDYRGGVGGFVAPPGSEAARLVGLATDETAAASGWSALLSQAVSGKGASRKRKGASGAVLRDQWAAGHLLEAESVLAVRSQSSRAMKAGVSGVGLVGRGVEDEDEARVKRALGGPDADADKEGSSGEGEMPSDSGGGRGRSRSGSTVRKLPSILSGLRGFDAGVLLSLSSSTREHLAEMSRQWRELRRTGLALRMEAAKQGRALEHLIRSKAREHIEAESGGGTMLAIEEGAVDGGSGQGLSPRDRSLSMARRRSTSGTWLMSQRPRTRFDEDQGLQVGPVDLKADADESRGRARKEALVDVPAYARTTAGSATHSFAARIGLGPTFSRVPASMRPERRFWSDRAARVTVLVGRAQREQAERREGGRPDLEEDDAQPNSGAIREPLDQREEAAAKAVLGDGPTWVGLGLLPVGAQRRQAAGMGTKDRTISGSSIVEDDSDSSVDEGVPSWQRALGSLTWESDSSDGDSDASDLENELPRNVRLFQKDPHRDGQDPESGASSGASSRLPSGASTPAGVRREPAPLDALSTQSLGGRPTTPPLLRAGMDSAASSRETRVPAFLRQLQPTEVYSRLRSRRALDARTPREAAAKRPIRSLAPPVNVQVPVSLGPLALSWAAHRAVAGQHRGKGNETGASSGANSESKSAPTSGSATPVGGEGPHLQVDKVAHGKAGPGSVLAAVPIIDEGARRRFWLVVQRSWRHEKRRRMALGPDDQDEDDVQLDEEELHADGTGPTTPGESLVLTSEARATVEADRYSAAAVERAKRQDRRRGRTPSSRVRVSGQRTEELAIRRAVQASIQRVEAWTKARLLGLLAYRQLHANPNFYAHGVDSLLQSASDIMDSLPESGAVAARVEALLQEKALEESARRRRQLQAAGGTSQEGSRRKSLRRSAGASMDTLGSHELGGFALESKAGDEEALGPGGKPHRLARLRNSATASMDGFHSDDVGPGHGMDHDHGGDPELEMGGHNQSHRAIYLKAGLESPPLSPRRKGSRLGARKHSFMYLQRHSSSVEEGSFQTEEVPTGTVLDGGVGPAAGSGSGGATGTTEMLVPARASSKSEVLPKRAGETVSAPSGSRSPVPSTATASGSGSQGLGASQELSPFEKREARARRVMQKAVQQTERRENRGALIRFGLFSSFGAVAGPPLGAASGGAEPHRLWGPVGPTPAHVPERLSGSPMTGGGVSPSIRGTAGSPTGGGAPSHVSTELVAEDLAEVELKVPKPPECFHRTLPAPLQQTRLGERDAASAGVGKHAASGGSGAAGASALLQPGPSGADAMAARHALDASRAGVDVQDGLLQPAPRADALEALLWNWRLVCVPAHSVLMLDDSCPEEVPQDLDAETAVVPRSSLVVVLHGRVRATVGPDTTSLLPRRDDSKYGHSTVERLLAHSGMAAGTGSADLMCPSAAAAAGRIQAQPGTVGSQQDHSRKGSSASALESSGPAGDGLLDPQWADDGVEDGWFRNAARKKRAAKISRRMARDRQAQDDMVRQGIDPEEAGSQGSEARKADRLRRMLGVDQASQGLALSRLGTVGGVDGLYTWVEYNSKSAPIMLGVSQLMRGSPAPAMVTASTGCVMLVLSRAKLRSVATVAPLTLTCLPYLECMSRPDRLVACVPCLAAALVDTSVSGRGAAHSEALSTVLGHLFKPVVVPAGRDIFLPGDDGDCAYVVAAGRVAVSAPTPTGAWVLLDVMGPGRCIGEPGLIVPAARSVRATALAPSLLMRITNSSLRGALLGRPQVWRFARNSVAKREPSELVRLAILSQLIGGEENADLLAPLTEVFRVRVLSKVRSRPLPVPSGTGEGPAGMADQGAAVPPLLSHAPDEDALVATGALVAAAPAPAPAEPGVGTGVPGSGSAVGHSRASVKSHGPAGGSTGGTPGRSSSTGTNRGARRHSSFVGLGGSAGALAGGVGTPTSSGGGSRRGSMFPKRGSASSGLDVVAASGGAQDGELADSVVGGRRALRRDALSRTSSRRASTMSGLGGRTGLSSSSSSSSRGGSKSGESAAISAAAGPSGGIRPEHAAVLVGHRAERRMSIRMSAMRVKVKSAARYAEDEDSSDGAGGSSEDEDGMGAMRGYGPAAVRKRTHVDRRTDWRPVWLHKLLKLQRGYGWAEDRDEDAFGLEVDEGADYPGMGGERVPLLAPLCTSGVAGQALHSLMLVASGSARVYPKPRKVTAEGAVGVMEAEREAEDGQLAGRRHALRNPAALLAQRESQPQVFGVGEWVGGRTLLTAQHDEQVAYFTVGTRNSNAVVMCLHKEQIVRFVRTLSGGHRRLKEWIGDTSGGGPGAAAAHVAVEASRTAIVTAKLTGGTTGPKVHV